MPTPLPIDAALPGLLERLKVAGSLVLQAEPGAGKTTRVPWALLEAGLAGSGEVVVLQPRRLAARLAARRVADERDQRLGGRVGYQVRFEEVAGPETRLRFVTEGILTRRLLGEPALRGVGAVVLDEFHERHLDGDLCLALLRRLQRGARPDLKVVVMSATLDPAPIAAWLGGAPVVEVPGRRYEIAVDHLPQPDARHLDQQVASALRRLVQEGLSGDVLVFLPGAGEIRRAREACEPLAAREDLLLTMLHGDLPPAEQDRAVRPADRRKVILSTNVAETSVTIEGVTAVIDSGLARVAGHSSWSGLPTLKVQRVAKASAVQRAGRAGRLGPGRCLRLYTRHDFETRPDYDAPEIRRVDLAEAALGLHAAGVGDLGAFGWFEPPPEQALAAADELLARLGALGAEGKVTDLGRRMLRFPLHPRLARVVLEAEARGRGEDGCLLAAIIAEREIRLEARTSGKGPARQASVSGPSDALESLEAFRAVQRDGFSAAALRSWGLDGGAVQAVERVRRSLSRALGRSGAKPADADPDRPLLVATLAGYPDRVARRRKSEGGGPSPELLLAAGGTARLSEQSVVRDAEYLVAVDAEERGGGGTARQNLVRVASAIEPEWLLDLFPERMRDATEALWNAQGERVEQVSRLLYDGLVVEESRGRADPERAHPVLAAEARARGPAAFADPEALAHFQARLAVAAGLAPSAGLPAVGPEQLDAALAELARGKTSFAEMREEGLLGALRAQLDGKQLGLLDRLCPERVRLPGGRQVQVHYEREQAPWIESRLQDFFGMAQGPSLGEGRLPLVLHLLAPNQRAVQVTTDLAGFWQRHYPAIRRELCRKYPRHSWPEDPLRASPPAPRGR